MGWPSPAACTGEPCGTPRHMGELGSRGKDMLGCRIARVQLA